MIKRFIKNVIKRFIPSLVERGELERKYKAIYHSSLLSYSQEGEDKVLERFMGNKAVGFYVDVGAHHPIRFSNTYLFYQKGWSGINIDAMPGSMLAFDETRSRDVNLEIGVSRKREKLNYYMFNEPALNTFSKDEAEKKNGLNNYKLVDTRQIDCLPLREILENYLKEGQVVDFLNIDVEGLDMQVLESIDWNRFKPNMILVESLVKDDLASVPLSELYAYLNSQNYKWVAKTYNTLFFKYSL